MGQHNRRHPCRRGCPTGPEPRTARQATQELERLAGGRGTPGTPRALPLDRRTRPGEEPAPGCRLRGDWSGAEPDRRRSRRSCPRRCAGHACPGRTGQPNPGVPDPLVGIPSHSRPLAVGRRVDAGSTRPSRSRLQGRTGRGSPCRGPGTAGGPEGSRSGCRLATRTPHRRRFPAGDGQRSDDGSCATGPPRPEVHQQAG